MRSPAGPPTAGHGGSPAVQPPAGTLTAPARSPRSSERPTSQQATHEARALRSHGLLPLPTSPCQEPRRRMADTVARKSPRRASARPKAQHLPLDGDPSDHPAERDPQATLMGPTRSWLRQRWLPVTTRPHHPSGAIDTARRGGSPAVQRQPQTQEFLDE